MYHVNILIKADHPSTVTQINQRTRDALATATAHCQYEARPSQVSDTTSCFLPIVDTIQWCSNQEGSSHDPCWCHSGYLGTAVVCAPKVIKLRFVRLVSGYSHSGRPYLHEESESLTRTSTFGQGWNNHKWDPGHRRRDCLSKWWLKKALASHKSLSWRQSQG